MVAPRLVWVLLCCFVVCCGVCCCAVLRVCRARPVCGACSMPGPAVAQARGHTPLLDGPVWFFGEHSCCPAAASVHGRRVCVGGVGFFGADSPPCSWCLALAGFYLVCGGWLRVVGGPFRVCLPSRTWGPCCPLFCAFIAVLLPPPPPIWEGGVSSPLDAFPWGACPRGRLRRTRKQAGSQSTALAGASS